MFVVISYDVTSDRRRSRLAKVLEGSGERVQYSVFECVLTPKQLKSVCQRIKATIDQRLDRVRIYVLPQDALPGIMILGAGQVTSLPQVYVV